MEEVTSDLPITVLGLGGAGCRTVGALHRMNPAGLRLLAVDTDRAGLEDSGLPPAQRLLAAADWRAGRGCGGSVIDGQRAMARERAALENLLTATPMVLVTGALGGGTASGGAGVILSVLRKLEIPALFMLTLPFTLEGHSKRRIAEEALRNDLLEMADAVLTLPNDLLFSVLPSTTPLAEAFALADREVAGTVLALTSVLHQGNLLAANFTDFSALLRRRKSFCSLGVGTASASGSDGTGRCLIALENMLQSPLLGGADKLSQADAVIFSLIGGPDLGIGETRQVLEQAQSFVGKNARILVGASTDAGFGDRIQLCALTIQFDRSEEIDAKVAEVAARQVRTARKPATPAATSITVSAGNAEQLTFELGTLSKGIMEKTTAVVWEGEDLDFPTFQRRNVTIDAGKTYSAEELKKTSNS